MIGALAVVVTLAYLALQIRASTRESEANLYTISSGQNNEFRGQFMEHADVWVKGNAGGELSASEQFVFEELVQLCALNHFFAFRRSVAQATGRQGIHVTALALFLQTYPAAYTIWRTQLEASLMARQRLGVSVEDDWARRVTEAVATLEGMEEPAAA